MSACLVFGNGFRWSDDLTNQERIRCRTFEGTLECWNEKSGCTVCLSDTMTCSIEVEITLMVRVCPCACVYGDCRYYTVL